MPQDLDELAKQFGGVVSESDLDALASQFGGSVVGDDGPAAFTKGFESKGFVGPKPPTAIEKASSFLRGGKPYQPKPLPESSWQNFGQTVAGDVLPPVLAAFAPNWAATQAMPQIAGAVRHPIDTLRSFVSPDQEMPLSEQAGHIASLGLTGLLPGARNPAMGETIGATGDQFSVPSIDPRLGRAVRGATRETIYNLPFVGPTVRAGIRGAVEGWRGPQEVFTGAGAKSNTGAPILKPLETPAGQGDVFTGAGAKPGTPKPVYKKLENLPDVPESGMEVPGIIPRLEKTPQPKPTKHAIPAVGRMRGGDAEVAQAAGTGEAEAAGAGGERIAGPGPHTMADIIAEAAANNEMPLSTVQRWGHKAFEHAFGKTKDLHNRYSTYMKEKYGVGSSMDVAPEDILKEYHHLEKIAAVKRDVGVTKLPPTPK